jgi:hypothetical protein
VSLPIAFPRPPRRMRSRTRRKLIAAAIGLAIALAPALARAQRYVPTADPAHPKLRYADSLTTPNDRCIVSHAKLNPKVRPAYVNGTPIGFC